MNNALSNRLRYAAAPLIETLSIRCNPLSFPFPLHLSRRVAICLVMPLNFVHQGMINRTYPP